MDVELKHGFKYHFQNDEVEAKFITISAYTMKHMSMVAPVKEIVMKAMGKLVEGVELTADDVEAAKAKDDVSNIDSTGLMTVIAMNCGEGDLGKLMTYMEKLLGSGVAYIDGSDVKLNGTWIPSLNPTDFENLCGEYIGNFIT